MRVVLSERVEAELEHHFAYGIKKSGRFVAERTFGRVRRFLLESLAAFPRGLPFVADVYEVAIPADAVYCVYRIDASADTLTVVALFHYAQDGESEWGDRRHTRHATAKPGA